MLPMVTSLESNLASDQSSGKHTNSQLKRILIIGPGGSGKSTLARRLEGVLRIEVIHLDRLYWRSGWIETSKDEWASTLRELLKRDSWIMDGNYSGTLELRVRACDTVLFLDLPRLVCIWRVIKRLLIYQKQDRPDMAEGCPERLSFRFLLWVWHYKRRTRPKVLTLLNSQATQKKIVWLRSQREVEAFVNDLRRLC